MISADEDAIHPETFDINSSEPQIRHFNKIKAGSVMGLVTKFKNDDGDIESKLMVYDMDPVLPPYDNIYHDLIFKVPIKEHMKEPDDEINTNDMVKDDIKVPYDPLEDLSNDEVNQIEPVENNNTADDDAQVVYKNVIEADFGQLAEYDKDISLVNDIVNYEIKELENDDSTFLKEDHAFKDEESPLDQHSLKSFEDVRQDHPQDDTHDLDKPEDTTITFEILVNNSTQTYVESVTEISDESGTLTTPDYAQNSEPIFNQEISDGISLKLETPSTDNIENDIAIPEESNLSENSHTVTSEKWEYSSVNSEEIQQVDEYLNTDVMESSYDSDESFKAVPSSVNSDAKIIFEKSVENILVVENESASDEVQLATDEVADTIKKYDHEQHESKIPSKLQEFDHIVEPSTKEKDMIVHDRTTDSNEIVDVDIKNLLNTAANDEFVSGLDDVDKFFEEVDPPDELDVGASGLSLQDVLVGQGLQIIKTRVFKGIEQLKRLSTRMKVFLNKEWTKLKYFLEDHFDVSIDDITLFVFDSLERLRDHHEHLSEIVSEKIGVLKDNLEGPYETLKTFYENNISLLVLKARDMIFKVVQHDDDDDEVDFEDNFVFESFKLDNFNTEEMQRRLNESRSKLM